MSYGIYKLWYPDNPKAVYIGKSENIEKRYKSHVNLLTKGLNTCGKLQKAYKGTQPYGKIEQLLTYDPTYLAIRENFYIVEYDAVSNGLNINYGTEAVRYEEGNQKENDQVRKAFVMALAKVDETTICLETGVTPKIMESIRQGKAFTWLQAEFPTEYKQAQITKTSKYRKGNYNEVLQARKLWVH